MSSWDEFCVQRRRAIERFVNGDVGPYKQLWCHADDVTIFGGWGAYEQGWDAVSRRLDWAASRHVLAVSHPSSRREDGQPGRGARADKAE